jgi:hypothetical protein
MNDGERLVFEGNLRRLKNKVQPEKIEAEVIGITTKEPVSKEGIGQLLKEAGQTSPPGTMVGNIESRINQLKQIGKELEKQTGEKATIEDILKQFGTSQGSLAKLQDEGLVRATTRQILLNDIKAGKIKNITVEDAINMKEPIDPFRQIYGEDALEQLDSLVPDLRKLTSEVDAEKLARSKFKFEPDVNRLPGSTSIEEAIKAEKEFGINKPQGEVIPFKKKPDEFAKGGSAGLDYLMGL